MSTPSDAPVLLYDGTCGFCARSVRFVLAHDRRGALRFGPLQGDFARTLAAAHPELHEVESVVWCDDSGVRARGDAALAVLDYLGDGWRVLSRLGRLLPRRLRDALYDAIARRRFRLAARACLLPTPDERVRFLA
jgi:predicted DCC family thiol-disulfide oxidoreductase YuxK